MDLTITLTLTDALTMSGTRARLDQKGDRSFRENLGFSAEHYDGDADSTWSESRAVTTMQDPAWQWYLDADRFLEAVIVRNALRAAGHRAELFNNLVGDPGEGIPDYFLVTDYDLHPGM